MARMNDRGQILLIGALVVATTFISLGIVLNGSFHTPSIASEASADTQADQLLQLRDTLERETAVLMGTANSQSWTRGERRDYIERNVSSLAESLEQYYARQDIALTVESVNPEPGAVIDESISAGDTSDTYTSTKVRNFDVDPSGLDSGDTITIRFDNGTHQNIVVDDTDLIVAGESCAHGGRIEVTNATTEDGPCGALEFVNSLDGSYTVEIIPGGLSSGSIDYRFMGRGALDGPPTHIYEVRIIFSLYSDDVTYDGEFHVAPGEP